jgi:quinol monooxygenase YgiN
MTHATQSQTIAHVTEAPHIVLLIRFTIKPGKRDAFLRGLTEVVDRMRSESSFIDAVISENVDHPHELVMYETWLGNRESWLRDEYPRPYRAQYEGVLADLVESRSVEWLTPLAIWYTDRARSIPTVE